MTDEIPPPSIPEEKAEAARTRRRWLTLAEILGVAAVTISALTLWNNYQHRSAEEARLEAEEAERAKAREKASMAAQALLLRATPDRDGRRLSLEPADPAQAIQEQRILFPAPLGIDPIETVSVPRIEADWFRRALLRVVGEGADRRGDARLPVAIETRFFVAGERHSDIAIYDIGYRIEGGGLLDGDEVRLRGLARVGAVPAGEVQARLDALWQERRAAAGD
jgi:hypothetical protein